MRNFIAPVLLVLAAAPLAACGGDGDDALAERAEDQAEAQADAMRANGMSDDAADAVEEAGEERADAIDDSDVDVDDLTPEQRNALVNGSTPAR
jgi:hypothetical protein